ncbi:MAG: M16 family metallopeptidase, partial [Gemmatimonadota bacterium]
MARRSERGASPRAVAETPPPVRTSELDEGVFRTRVRGGPEVWSERMDSLRSVAVGFWFRSGAAHDSDASAGLAHLLEHMVFKGTERRSARELAAEIEELGGSLDAYTTHEHTCLQARVPEDALAVALDVLGDLAFHARLDPVDLELERQVVLEELARAEDTPDDIVFDLAAEFLFGSHPYGRPVLGRRETVEALDASALRERYDADFRPGNLVVAAAGRLAHDELLELLGGVLTETGGDPTPRIAAPERFASGSREVARPGGRQSHIVAGAAGVSATDPLRHAVTLVDTALGGGMGSRLFQRVREELGLA